MYTNAKAVFDLYAVPECLYQYWSVHFYAPFVQAQWEREQIDTVFYTLFQHQESPHCVRHLLFDTSIRLDTQIRDGRIETFVQLIKHTIEQLEAAPSDRIISVLKKGLLVEDLHAYHLITKYYRFAGDAEMSFFLNTFSRKLLLSKEWRNLVLTSLPEQLLRTCLDHCEEEPLLKIVTVFYGQDYPSVIRIRASGLYLMGKRGEIVERHWETVLRYMVRFIY